MSATISYEMEDGEEGNSLYETENRAIEVLEQTLEQYMASGHTVIKRPMDDGSTMYIAKCDSGRVVARFRVISAFSEVCAVSS